MPVEPNPYDTPELIELRKGQGDPLILYLIVRESLGMGVGKIAAQCAHATQMVMLRHLELERDAWENQMSPAHSPSHEAAQKLRSVVEEWLRTSFRKVVLKADDKEWAKIKETVNVFVVKDAGLTEVEAGSETVMALWPMRKSEAPKIIQRLQVLK